MASLIVRNLEDAVVQKLKEEAVRQKISAEEAHRRLLRRALLEEPETSQTKSMSFSDFLLTMPDFPDECEVFFERQKGENRPVDLEG